MESLGWVFRGSGGVPGRLPERPRELLTLHYFGGLPLARVGELTGLSAGAVKTALCRARQRLRQSMEEDGYEV